MKKLTLLCAGLMLAGTALAQTEAPAGWTVSAEYTPATAIPVAKETDIDPATSGLFKGVQVGDRLDVYMDDWSGSKLALATKVGDGWTWTQFVDYVMVTGPVYTYTFTDADEATVEALKGRELIIKGEGSATVTKIVRLTPEGNAPVVGDDGIAIPAGWEVVSSYAVTEKVPFGEWKGELSIPAATFADVKVDDKIMIYAEAEKGAQVQINGAQPWTEIVGYADFADGEYAYTVTDEFITNIKSGLVLKGQKATVTCVKVIRKKAESGEDPVDPTPGDDDYTLEGYTNVGEYTPAEAVLGEWGKEYETGGVFSGVKPGDKVIVYADAQAGGQLQLVTKEGADWSYLKLIDCADFVDGQVAYTVADENIADLINSRGLWFKGQNATVKKIIIWRKDTTTGVAAVEIDFNAPVEIYTIDGVRVSEMAKGGLYIVRQGNNVMKIRK